MEYIGPDHLWQETAMARHPRYGFLALLLLAAAMLSAQSNEMIDAILAEEAVSIGSAAYLALSAAQLIADDATPGHAVTVAREAGWVSGDAVADEPATFGELAYLLMRATGVNGGLMYRLIPGPRYAAREFAYRRWSPERIGPRERVSGQFAVRVTGNFLDRVEGSR